MISNGTNKNSGTNDTLSSSSSSNGNYNFNINSSNFDKLTSSLTNTERLLTRLNSSCNNDLETLITGLKLGLKSLKSTIYAQQSTIVELSKGLLQR